METQTRIMTSTNTLLQRIARAISTAPQGETYEDCLNNKAKAAGLEIAKWLEEDNTPTGVPGRSRRPRRPAQAPALQDVRERHGRECISS